MTKLLEENPKKRTPIDAAYFLFEHNLVTSVKLPNGSEKPQITEAGLEQIDAIVAHLLEKLKRHPNLNFSRMSKKTALFELKVAVLDGTGGEIETLVRFYSGELYGDLREIYKDLSTDWSKNQ